MNIIKYRLELDENRHNILVRESDTEYNGENFNDPLAVAEMLKNNYRLHAQAEEHMYVVALTTACEPLGVFEIAHGWVNGAFARPREIFIRLLLAGASGFVLCHNHPSGDCRPSKADIQVTGQIKECADFMAVSLFDHIIIGDRCFSFRVNGML